MWIDHSISPILGRPRQVGGIVLGGQSDYWLLPNACFGRLAGLVGEDGGGSVRGHGEEYTGDMASGRRDDTERDRSGITSVSLNRERP
jgi:hypothetical protein